MIKSIAILLVLTSTVLASQNVVVVFDDSGSMDESLGDQTKIQVAKESLATMCQKMPDDAKIGVVCLNAGWIVPLGPINRQNVINSINKINAGGGTPLGEYMKKGADALLAVRSKDHYGTYRLIIITDGEAGDPELVDQYNNDIMTRGIHEEVIGVNMAGDHQLATKVNAYYKANDPESLKKAIFNSFAESNGQPATDGNDFDIIAPIPSQVAEAVVKTISDISNSPIGEQPKSSSSASPAAPASPNDDVIKAFVIIGVIAGGLFVIILIASILQ